MGYFVVTTTTVSEFVAAMERLHPPQQLLIALHKKRFLIRTIPVLRYHIGRNRHGAPLWNPLEAKGKAALIPPAHGGDHTHPLRGKIRPAPTVAKGVIKLHERVHLIGKRRFPIYILKSGESAARYRLSFSIS